MTTFYHDDNLIKLAFMIINSSWNITFLLVHDAHKHAYSWIIFDWENYNLDHVRL